MLKFHKSLLLLLLLLLESNQFVIHHLFCTKELKYNVTLSAENEHEYTCPITEHNQGSTAKFAEEVRRNSRAQAEGSCPNKKQAFTFSNNR